LASKAGDRVAPAVGSQSGGDVPPGAVRRRVAKVERDIAQTACPGASRPQIDRRRAASKPQYARARSRLGANGDKTCKIEAQGNVDRDCAGQTASCGGH